LYELDVSFHTTHTPCVGLIDDIKKYELILLRYSDQQNKILEADK